MGLTTGVPFPARVTDFFSLYSVQIDYGVHSAPYSIGTRCSFLGVQRPRREADHSPPSTAEVKNGGAIPPLPHISMA
jgi:hypothetical protein